MEQQMVLPGCSASTTTLVDSPIDFSTSAFAASTLRAYRHDWQSFATWCINRAYRPLPSSIDTLISYLTHLATSGRKVAGIERALAAITFVHARLNAPSPATDPGVRQVMRGIRRRLGCHQDRKAPIVISHLRRLVAATPDDKIIGVRDRALILLGFASAMRRQELVSLDVEDISAQPDGLLVRLRRSKTDQEGQGRDIGIPFGSKPETCPVRAVKSWLTDSGIDAGPLFVSINRHGRLGDRRIDDGAVARMLKKYAILAGLEPTSIAGHSLRSGLVTSAVQAGKSEQVIMQQTGHTSVATLRRYVRQATLFQENAASGIGL
jgi:site-specific recombinase XerD